jgi:hypothetical protein
LERAGSVRVEEEMCNCRHATLESSSVRVVMADGELLMAQVAWRDITRDGSILLFVFVFVFVCVYKAVAVLVTCKRAPSSTCN